MLLIRVTAEVVRTASGIHAKSFNSLSQKFLEAFLRLNSNTHNPVIARQATAVEKQFGKLSHFRLPTLLFSSPAAGSAFKFQRSRHSYFLLSNSFIVFTTTRHYAKSRKKMPPKKVVKEEKLLLGRPGNNLKSGIVR
jgi:hypothetical protein